MKEKNSKLNAQDKQTKQTITVKYFIPKLI